MRRDSSISQPRLLLGNVGPLLIELQVRQREAAHALVKEPLAGIAEEYQQLAQGIAIDARGPFRGPDAHPFNQQPQGQLGIGYRDAHLAERLGPFFGPTLAAQAALKPLVTVAVLASGGVLCWVQVDMTSESFPFLGAFAIIRLPGGIGRKLGFLTPRCDPPRLHRGFSFAALILRETAFRVNTRNVILAYFLVLTRNKPGLYSRNEQKTQSGRAPPQKGQGNKPGAADWPLAG